MRSNYKRIAIALAVLMVGVLTVMVAHPGLATAAQPQNSAVYAPFGCTPESDCNVVGTSQLVRSANGATYNIRTSGLPPGHAFTNWWIIFNNPDGCSDPCGENDVFILDENGDVVGPNLDGRAAAEISVVFATGHVIGGNGKAGFAAHISEGDTDDAVFGPGLTNIVGSEIHLVVRGHGEKIPALVSDQISTLHGGCVSAPADGSQGAPGPNNCVDTQFAVHLPM